MGIIEKIKKAVHEILHPSFESLMKEFAIVEDASTMNEERLEHFRAMIEQRKAQEARMKAQEEKKRRKEEARAAAKAAKESRKSAKTKGDKNI